MGDRGVIIDVLFFLVCLFALDKVRRNTILLLLGVVGLIVLGGFFFNVALYSGCLGS